MVGLHFLVEELADRLAEHVVVRVEDPPASNVGHLGQLGGGRAVVIASPVNTE